MAMSGRVHTATCSKEQTVLLYSSASWVLGVGGLGESFFVYMNPGVPGMGEGLESHMPVSWRVFMMARG